MSKKSKKKIIEDRHTTRRQFLIGLGNSTMFLPPLVSLMSSSIARAAMGRAKRVILVPTLYGIDHKKFFPSTPAANLQTAVPGAIDMWTTPLSQIQNNMSVALGGAFDDPVLRSKMNIYEGLDVTHGGEIVSHTRGSLAGVARNRDLGGGNSEPLHGRTIDNIIAKSAGFYKNPSPFPVMRICTGAGSRRWSYEHINGKINWKDFTMGDKNIFNKYFANVGNQNSMPDQGKLSAIDAVLADLNLLKSHKRISAADKILLDRYITSVDETHKKINANHAPVCSKPSVNFQVTQDGQYYAFPGNYDGKTWGVRSSTALIDNYNSMIASAFLCDLSRVVVFGNEIYQDNPISRYESQSKFHSHDDGTGGPLTTAQKHAYFLDRIADLAKTLDSIPDPISESGSLLDNSIIMFTNEHGGPASAHNVRQIPTLTIGSAGGYFKTGYYIDSRRRPIVPSGHLDFRGYIGRPNKQLLISIMQACGLQKSEYINYGDGKGFGDFNVSDSVNGSVGYNAFLNSHNDGLPFIKA